MTDLKFGKVGKLALDEINVILSVQLMVLICVFAQKNFDAVLNNLGSLRVHGGHPLGPHMRCNKFPMWLLKLSSISGWLVQVIHQTFLRCAAAAVWSEIKGWPSHNTGVQMSPGLIIRLLLLVFFPFSLELIVDRKKKCLLSLWGGS